MWFTTRQEGLDDPRPAMRGPCLDLPTTVFCGGVGGNSFLLRGGFLLQLFSLTGLFISYWASGGAGLFGYELQGMNEVCLLFGYSSLNVHCKRQMQKFHSKPQSAAYLDACNAYKPFAFLLGKDQRQLPQHWATMQQFTKTHCKTQCFRFIN